MSELTYCYAAMNAGKSMTLLQRAHSYQECGMRAVIYTAALDTRAGNGVVASRIGISNHPCYFGRLQGQQLCESTAQYHPIAVPVRDGADLSFERFTP